LDDFVSLIGVSASQSTTNSPDDHQSLFVSVHRYDLIPAGIDFFPADFTPSIKDQPSASIATSICDCDILL
jgi:hypothetical protein